MYTSNDEKVRQQIRSYQIQIVVLFFLVIALVVAIILVKDLINQIKYGIRVRNRAKRAKFSALIYIIVGLYITYINYKNFLKNKNQTNLIYLIASELGLIAVIIRYNAISEDEVTNYADII